MTKIELMLQNTMMWTAFKEYIPSVTWGSLHLSLGTHLVVAVSIPRRFLILP
jgi:hypothetical protein